MSGEFAPSPAAAEAPGAVLTCADAVHKHLCRCTAMAGLGTGISDRDGRTGEREHADPAKLQRPVQQQVGKGWRGVGEYGGEGWGRGDGGIVQLQRTGNECVTRVHCVLCSDHSLPAYWRMFVYKH